MQYPLNSSTLCTSCSSSEAAITDPESGETICSTCGMVIPDKIDDIIHQEGRAFTFEDVDKRARTGAPSSLARHDRGLTTLIGVSASLAATVLYLACKKTGEFKSQDNLAEAAGITGVTIRARLKELTRSIELN